MTEKKVSDKKAGAEAKPKVAKKPTASKTKAEVAVTKSGKTITVKQVGSPIGRQAYQRGTLIGLGLNKMQRTRTLEDSPSVRGMIESVKHLVEVVSDQ